MRSNCEGHTRGPRYPANRRIPPARLTPVTLIMATAWLPGSVDHPAFQHPNDPGTFVHNPGEDNPGADDDRQARVIADRAQPCCADRRAQQALSAGFWIYRGRGSR